MACGGSCINASLITSTSICILSAEIVCSSAAVRPAVPATSEMQSRITSRSLLAMHAHNALHAQAPHSIMQLPCGASDCMACKRMSARAVLHCLRIHTSFVITDMPPSVRCRCCIAARAPSGPKQGWPNHLEKVGFWGEWCCFTCQCASVPACRCMHATRCVWPRLAVGEWCCFACQCASVPV